MIMVKNSTGRNIRNMDIPALFRAVSSKYSPKRPKAISDDTSMASGKAIVNVLRLK